MIEQRRARRRAVDFGVKKVVAGESYCCRACEISPTGIRLERLLDQSSEDRYIEIQLPLVEGQLTTQVAARRVWRRAGFEAFEFVGPSFAQQAMLERMFGNL
jgi:hypothetical protein